MKISINGAVTLHQDLMVLWGQVAGISGQKVNRYFMIQHQKFLPIGKKKTSISCKKGPTGRWEETGC